MLMLAYLVWTWISCIYGAAIDAVQESVTTAELGGQVAIWPSETCSLDIWVINNPIRLDLLKDVQKVEERKVVLKGQNVICMLGKDEAVERYVDYDIGAEAIIISRTTGGTLERKMVVHFQLAEKTVSLEPDWSSFIGCSGEERKGEVLANFVIFGEDHYLYEVDEDEDKATSEEVVTTTVGGPVDPPVPPIFIIVISVVCGLILILLVAFSFWRCCCRSAAPYNSM